MAQGVRRVLNQRAKENGEVSMVINGFAFLAGLVGFTGTILHLAQGPKSTANANTVRRFQIIRWVVLATILIGMVTFLGEAGVLAVGGLAIGVFIGFLARSAGRR
jgi:hypothetical protein